MVVAQRILRHSDPRLTANIYTRVDVEDLRAGLDRISIQDMSPDLVSGILVPVLSPGLESAQTKALTPGSNMAEDQGPSLVGARGFEPPTPCAQGRCATRLRYAPIQPR